MLLKNLFSAWTICLHCECDRSEMVGNSRDKEGFISETRKYKTFSVEMQLYEENHNGRVDSLVGPAVARATEHEINQKKMKIFKPC